jgi:ATP-dependent exoDNAse (exonuclease V) beta subunit
MPKKLNLGIVKNVKMLQDSSLAEVYEEENKLNELDFVNMIYVAFTRPERELYSLISEKDDAEFFALIKNFINEKQLFIEIEENVYGYGTQVRNEKKEEKLDDDEIGISPEYKFFTNDWRNIARLKLNYSGNLSFDKDNLLEKGKHIHSVLSKIYSIDDFEAVIENYRQLGIIEKSEMDYIEQKINKMLENKLIKSFFDKDNKVLNEQNILLPNSNEKIPDRIIHREDNTIVVDYKLSDYESINQNLLQKYKAQISEYSDALSSMGLKNIKSYLVFLKGEIYVLEVV